MTAVDSISQVILYLLSNYQHQDAIFLAERYHAEVNTHYSLWILATSYYRNGEVKRAKYFLKKNLDLCDSKCILLYVRCCCDLQQYPTGLTILNKVLGGQPNEENIAKVFEEDASVAFWLLGELNRLSKLSELAVQFYKLSLKTNPFMWSSFKALCSLGEKVTPSDYFEASKCPKTILSANMFKTSDQTAALNLKHFSKGNQDVGQSTPDLFFNLAVGGATASSTPRFVGTADTLRKKVVFSSVEGSVDSNSPSTPFAWSLGRSGPNGGWVRRGQDRADLKTAATALHFTPDVSANTSPLVCSQSTPIEPLSTVPSHTQSVPSIARVAWSTTSGHTVAPLDYENQDEYAEDNIALMPPPKAPVKSSVIPLRRSTRISTAIAKGSGSSVVNTPSVSSRHRSHASTSRLGMGGGSPHRGERLRFSPSRKSPRKQHSSEDHSAPVVQSTRRTLTFTSKVPEDVDPSSQVSATSDAVMQVSAVDGLMSLVAHLACAYQALAFNDLVHCVDLFQMLPSHHICTSWVQTCVGLAYFRAERYKKAVEVLREVHQRDPHKLEGMDYYSSALWQLKKVEDLEVLGLDLERTCDQRPETWCVLGNTKSAANNQRGALQCFLKAVKVDPQYSYGHVLAGLELCHLDDLEGATESFMKSLFINPRDFHGLSGMGMVNDAKERHEEARINYSKALSINQHSSLICCQLGMTLIRLHQESEGLAYINRAVANNPRLPIAHFNKSVALQATGSLEEAVLELKKLAKLCPSEPKIFVQIGKMMYDMERPQDAIQYFSWALNCDPTNTHIRQEIDSVLQLQGATVRRGPDMSLSGHHSGFQGLEDDDSHFDEQDSSSGDNSSMES